MLGTGFGTIVFVKTSIYQRQQQPRRAVIHTKFRAVYMYSICVFFLFHASEEVRPVRLSGHRTLDRQLRCFRRVHDVYVRTRKIAVFVLSGIHAMDPYGEEELERTEACISKLRSSPTVAGSAWGPVDSPPTWLPHACLTR